LHHLCILFVSIVAYYFSMIIKLYFVSFVQYYFSVLFSSLGAVYKRHPHKIVKNWPPTPCPQNVCTGSIRTPFLLSLQTHHKFSKNPKLFGPKTANVGMWRTPIVCKMSELNPPPNCERLLWTAPYNTITTMINTPKVIRHLSWARQRGARPLRFSYMILIKQKETLRCYF